MQKLEHKRFRYAWLLLLVYLPMLLAVSFHHHEEMEETTPTVYCYDCAHHIHHDGHFQVSQAIHACALCVMQSMTYTAPVIVCLATFVAVTRIAPIASRPFIKKLQGNVLSTRAPPVVLQVVLA